jgi:hypothetical protein
VKNTVSVFLIVLDEARLDNARSQIQAVWHDSCTEDAASLIDSVER